MNRKSEEIKKEAKKIVKIDRIKIIAYIFPFLLCSALFSAPERKVTTSLPNVNANTINKTKLAPNAWPSSFIPGKENHICFIIPNT